MNNYAAEPRRQMTARQAIAIGIWSAIGMVGFVLLSRNLAGAFAHEVSTSSAYSLALLASLLNVTAYLLFRVGVATSHIDDESAVGRVFLGVITLVPPTLLGLCLLPDRAMMSFVWLAFLFVVSSVIVFFTDDFIRAAHRRFEAEATTATTPTTTAQLPQREALSYQVAVDRQAELERDTSLEHRDERDLPNAEFDHREVLNLRGERFSRRAGILPITGTHQSNRNQDDDIAPQAPKFAERLGANTRGRSGGEKRNLLLTELRRAETDNHSTQPDEQDDDLDEQCSQRLIRRCDHNGGESLEGFIRVSFVPGQKLSVLHLPFSPPFAAIPTVDCETADGDNIRAKIAFVQTYGMRIDLKRISGWEQAGTEEIQFYVSAPAIREAA